MIGGAVRAADYVEQPGVADWPLRLALIAILVLVIAACLWAMRRGWVNRKARQADIPPPPDHPPAGAHLAAPVEGLYAGTGTHGDWLDRIAVHDLGVRSRATMSFGPNGIWLDRVGARSLFVPGSEIVAVRADRGVAGTVRDRDGMIVVTWRLGTRLVDTGFRADAGADHRTCLDGLMSQFAPQVR